MNKEYILEKVQDIFRDIFDDETLIIKQDTSPNNIGDWDSLAQINLIVAIEKDFGIKFNLEEIQKLRNVGDTLALIFQKINKNENS
jgi:acyl carrier protein|tara:strand:- start:2853 stop:3110 length:258 start_codon:yes stop_codon:yes gene_type:complete